jgi:hypothetical protein
MPKVIKSMSRAEFRRRIENLYGADTAQTRFAEAARIHPRTVRRWVQPDGIPVPGYARTIVELLERVAKQGA